jgi:hypothetical protein
LKRPKYDVVKVLASLHETGAGSITEFFKELPKKDFNYFWALMKYDELNIDDKEVEKYRRSCARFRNDLLKIADYFLNPLHNIVHQAYKHGLAMTVVRDRKSGRDVIMVPCQDGTFDIFMVHPMWYLGAFETIEIISAMFSRLVEPLISWYYLEKAANVDLSQQSLKVKFDVNMTEEDIRKRPIKLSLNIVMPWKIHQGEKIRPFY